MKKPELTISRLLLITLGVITALIIGLNSSVIGVKETHSQLIDMVPERTLSLVIDTFEFIGGQVNSQLNTWI